MHIQNFLKRQLHWPYETNSRIRGELHGFYGAVLNPMTAEYKNIGRN